MRRTLLVPRADLLRVPVLLLVAVVAVVPHAAAQEVTVDVPDAFLSGIGFTVTVSTPRSLDTLPVRLLAADGTVLGVGQAPPVGQVVFRDVVIASDAQLPLRVIAGAATETITRPVIPGWFSLIPPLVAIALALVFREVVSSLFAGVWLGAILLAGFNPLTGLLDSIGRFIQPALADGDHASIVVFSLLLGGMVGIMARMGGTRAIVDAVTPLATTRRRGLFATWVAGLAIFFDDYANTLIVGNTMRPLTDKLKISREKLAYIVDSTAAPVTVIVFVSTWVGFEIGLIGDALRIAAAQQAADPAYAQTIESVSPFAVYLHSVPYLFYPLLAIFAVGIFIWTGRDFGPMLAAERRAVSGGGLHAPGAQLASDPNATLGDVPDGAPLRWWNGALPVVTVVVVVVWGLWATGAKALGPNEERTLSTVLGAADPFVSLLWGSLAGCVVGVLLAVGQRILTLKQTIDAWASGLRAMVLAMVILVLAWSLGNVTTSLGTASFLSTVLSDRLALELVPVTVFFVAALISFATGTSWATMAILFPLVVPLVVSMEGNIDFSGGHEYRMLLASIASVMAGSIFGDHCSPISDTTVLSSTASGCDHMDHVRTQLPYAVVIALVTMVLGNLATAYGVPVWVALLLSAVTMWVIIRFVGAKAEVAVSD